MAAQNPFATLQHTMCMVLKHTAVGITILSCHHLQPSYVQQQCGIAEQDSHSVASSVQQDLLDKAEQQLQHQQDAFVTELLRPQSALQVRL